jgi:hypothetical protein
MVSSKVREEGDPWKDSIQILFPERFALMKRLLVGK